MKVVPPYALPMVLSPPQVPPRARADGGMAGEALPFRIVPGILSVAIVALGVWLTGALAWGLLALKAYWPLVVLAAALPVPLALLVDRLFFRR